MAPTRTFAIRLEIIENDTRQEFLALLADPEVKAEDIDLPTFSRIMRLAHFSGIAAGEFASKFGVTLSTVSRWRTDVAYPGLWLRGEIIEFIRTRLSELRAAA